MTAFPVHDNKILALLRDVAEQGLPCPTDDDMAERLVINVGTVRNAICRLKARGEIAIVTKSNCRRVTIVSSGKVTESRRTKLPKTLRHEDERTNHYVSRAAPRTFQTIDRTPCPYCGVRGDIGCRHRRPAQPEQVVA